MSNSGGDINAAMAAAMAADDVALKPMNVKQTSRRGRISRELLDSTSFDNMEETPEMMAEDSSPNPIRAPPSPEHVVKKVPFRPSISVKRLGGEVSIVRSSPNSVMTRFILLAHPHPHATRR